MAYFHCLIGGGSSGGGYELTVTCDAQFAGTTITCTDGVTTLTQTCPSASPYEVVFEIPNGGDWTISGVVSGQTVTTGVNIPTTATLVAYVQKTITIYSAKEDTVTYTDIYGDTQTEVFASGQTSKQITVDILASGSSITFTSGVAKNPTNLSSAYSKTVTITSNTTDVYLMPDNALYWWGYEDSNLEDCSSANGWTASSAYSFVSPSRETYDIDLNPGSTNGKMAGVGIKNAVTANSIKCVSQGISIRNNVYGNFSTNSTKNTDASNSTQINTNTLKQYNLQGGSDIYIMVTGWTYTGTARSKLYALWYE